MQFIDEGYIINCRKHGENSLIINLLTKEHGRVCGYVKSGYSKKKMAIFQAGNFIKIDAWSRVDDNMLTLKVELITPYAVDFIASADKLQVLSCFCSLSNICLPELQNVEKLYDYASDFVKAINQENWLTYYCYYEFYLLDFLGIGVDLSKCAATGSNQNLTFVSPKSGCAVSYEAGLPYAERLFNYPHFIAQKKFDVSLQEQVELLKMTEFFLKKNFFTIHNLKFPICRVSLGADLQDHKG